MGPGNIGLLMLESLHYSYCAVGPGNIGLLMIEALYYRHATVLWGLAI